MAVRLDRRGDRPVRVRGPARAAAAGARAGLPVRRRPRDAAGRARLACRVAVLPHARLPGVGRRAVALHARPGAPGGLEIGAPLRRRDSHVGGPDLRALSELVMVHWSGQLHLGQLAAPRRACDRARAPPATRSVTHMTIAALVIVSLLLQAPTRTLTASPTRPLGTLREQAALQQEWLRYRLDSVLPALMRKHGIAMWVIPMREYNEDPVFWALVSHTTFFARRRTIYVFSDRGPDKGVERLALGGTSQGGVRSEERRVG